VIFGLVRQHARRGRRSGRARPELDRAENSIEQIESVCRRTIRVCELKAVAHAVELSLMATVYSLSGGCMPICP
jgi:hypothetical protein